MANKYRETLLFIALCVVVVIIVDLVFNFSGVFMENYDEFIKSQEDFQNGPDYTSGITRSIDDIPGQKIRDDKDITGVMNMKTGKIIGVNVVKRVAHNDVREDNYTEVQIVFNGQALTVDGSGNTTLSISDSSSDTQLFEVVLITGSDMFNDIIPSEGFALGKDVASDYYPFYILRSKVSQGGEKKRCLYYDGGNLYFGIIANYDAVKFDITYENIDIRKTPLYNSNKILEVLNDNFRIGESDDNMADNLGLSTDKIKINLNLGDNFNNFLDKFSKQQESTNVIEDFVNYNKKENFTDGVQQDIVQPDTRSDYFENDKKDEYCNKNYVKRSTLASICPGCTGLEDYNLN